MIKRKPCKQTYSSGAAAAGRAAVWLYRLLSLGWGNPTMVEKFGSYEVIQKIFYALHAEEDLTDKSQLCVYIFICLILKVLPRVVFINKSRTFWGWLYHRNTHIQPVLVHACTFKHTEPHSCKTCEFMHICTCTHTNFVFAYLSLLLLLYFPECVSIQSSFPLTWRRQPMKY